jgi:hypothetical protein
MPVPLRNGYASRVNILKYIKVADKWRFAPAETNNKPILLYIAYSDNLCSVPRISSQSKARITGLREPQ